MTSGIYFIVNSKDMKRYVGQSVDITKRLSEHWGKLKHSKHDNAHLQNAYNKYGRDAFFEISTPCSIEDLTEREQYFIDTMWDMCYNICKIANTPPSWRGKKRGPQPAETKAKISAANKGKQSSQYGRPRTTMEKKKISAGGRGPIWQHADEIKTLRSTGLLYREIAERYSSSGETIRRICLS